MKPALCEWRIGAYLARFSSSIAFALHAYSRCYVIVLRLPELDGERLLSNLHVRNESARMSLVRRNLKLRPKDRARLACEDEPVFTGHAV
jgi:hypothetical protein